MLRLAAIVAAYAMLTFLRGWLFAIANLREADRIVRKVDRAVILSEMQFYEGEELDST